MKKLKVIGAAGLCVLLVGGTAIVSEAFMPKQEVTINEEEDIKMSEKANMSMFQVDNLIPPILEEKSEESIVTEAPAAAEAVQEENASQPVVQEETPATPAAPKEEPVANIVTPQEEAPAAPQQEVPAAPQQEPAANTAPQEAYVQPAYNYQGSCPFVDENHDGICDYSGSHCHNGSHVDADGDGFCDYGDHYCMQNYTDTNVDGVCDNYQSSHGAHHNYGYNSGNTSSGTSGATSGNTSSGSGYGYGSHHSGGHHGRGHH